MSGTHRIAHDRLTEAPREGVRWSLAGFALMAAFQLWLVFTHTPWRDETQARLIAEEPWGRMFGLLHYEGHPALWYLALKAASAVLPADLVLPGLQAVVALGTLALIWRASPFGVWMKAALSLNLFVLIEYGVVARSYGLGVLLFFAFLALRRSFWAWVVLALMANVSLHFALLAGVCALWLAFEGRWSWKGVALLAVGGLAALATMWPAPDVVRAAPLPGGPAASLLMVFWNAKELWGLSLPKTPRPALEYGMLIGIAAVGFGGWVVRREGHYLLLYLLLATGLLAIGSFVYMTFSRHLALLVLLVAGVAWVKAERGEPLPVEGRAWLGVLAASGLFAGVICLIEPMSISRDVASWARANGVAGRAWTAWPAPHGLEFTAYTDRPTFNLVKGCWNTFHRWDYDPKVELAPGELARRITSLADAQGGAYLLAQTPPAGVRAQVLHRFRGNWFPNDLSVYRIDAAPGAERRALPACR